MNAVLNRLDTDAKPTVLAPAESVSIADSMVDRLMTIHHGVSRGHFALIADCGPMTAGDLAHLTGISVSRARTWLDTQVMLGVLKIDRRDVPRWERRYRLPAAKAALLLDLDDPFQAKYDDSAMAA